jgi:hypothetical protein
MIDDPIVEEIHRVRERLLDECGGSLERLMDRLQAREEEDRSRLIRGRLPRGSGGLSPGPLPK